MNQTTKTSTNEKGDHMNLSTENNSSMDKVLSTAPSQVTQQLSREDEHAIIQDLVATKRSNLELVRAKNDAADKLGLTLSELERVYKAEKANATNPPKQQAESGSSILFADVQPWHESVDGAEVLNDVLEVLKCHVIANRETLHAAALWVCMTWFVEQATVLPLAMITAPEKGCGKSTLLAVMAKMAYKPLAASNTTAAATFRAIEAVRPTLFIDEADTFLRDDEGMRSILNSGHTRDSAYVLRTVGEQFETKQFSTWCAKAVCGIGHLPETIESRSIILKMRRKKSGEFSENIRHAKAKVFDTIKQKLARWSADNAKAFADLHPVMVGLSNRDADNYEPLLAIATLAGGAWVDRITNAARILTESDQDNRSVGVDLLDACRTVFDTLADDKISSARLIVEICNDSESRFATYNRGREMTVKQMSRCLGEYGVRSKTIRLRSGETLRGFERDQFTEAFEAYLDDVVDTLDSFETSLPSTEYAGLPVSNENSSSDVIVTSSPDKNSGNDVPIKGSRKNQTITSHSTDSVDCNDVADDSHQSNGKNGSNDDDLYDLDSLLEACS